MTIEILLYSLTMKKIINYISILLFFGIITTACAQSSAELNSSQHAFVENAVFTDFDGNEFSISDFEGKTIMIDFWETWCAPCINMMPTLDKLMEDYEDNFVVLATSPLWMDDEAAILRFVEQHDYRMLFVKNSELATQLEVTGIPYKVFVKPDGTFYKAETGSRGPARDYEVIKEIIEKFM